MKIIKNTSIFSTAFIKRVCVATHVHMALVEGRLAQWSRLKLEVGSKRSGYSGYAYYNGTYMRFSLATDIDVQRLVELAYHELMHVYGYHHKHGCDPSKQDVARICEALGVSDEAAIPRKEVVRIKRDLVRERYQRMLMRRQTWGTKVKRAQNALAKVNKEIDAYLRRHGERLNGEV